MEGMEGLYYMFGIAALAGLCFTIVFYIQDRKEESQKSHIKQ
ncbi:MAG: hypothetical protein ABH886_08600 [Candidatus Desantisbacteria bacterium]